MRMVGSTLVGQIGGAGLPVVRSARDAAEMLLRNEPVRMPAGAFVRRVRQVIGRRALLGQGPDGEGRNWATETVDE